MTNMIDINSTIFIITLNINDHQLKDRSYQSRHKKSKKKKKKQPRKQDPTIYCHNKHKLVKSKGMGKN